MIPRDYITEWRAQAPWVSDLQVEQDLVISRALVELFARPDVAQALAFRGGTALYKLHLRPAARYSEDIDLVQVASGPIGPVLKVIRTVLDPWLGEPRWKQGRRKGALSGDPGKVASCSTSPSTPSCTGTWRSASSDARSSGPSSSSARATSAPPTPAS